MATGHRPGQVEELQTHARLVGSAEWGRAQITSQVQRTTRSAGSGSANSTCRRLPTFFGQTVPIIMPPQLMLSA